MTAFQNINELNKVIRESLIRQSGLHEEQVLNALAIHGEDLNVLFREQVYVSLERQNAMILFELRSRRNDTDMSQTVETSIESYRSFQMYVIIYGDDSSDIATKVVSRFRTEEVREKLRVDGVYLEKISEPTTFNEYKNETMWIRNDIAIDISCKFEVAKVDSAEHFEHFEINVI